MGKPTTYMLSMLLLNLIWFTSIHARSLVDVSSIGTHSVSVAYNNVAAGQLTAFDKGVVSNRISTVKAIDSLRGGAYLLPAGWNPLGYKITDRKSVV